MKIYALEENSKAITCYSGITSKLFECWTRIEPGRDVSLEARRLELCGQTETPSPGRMCDIPSERRRLAKLPELAPTDVVIAPVINFLFSSALKDCLVSFIVDEPVKWIPITLALAGKEYDYYALIFTQELKREDFVCDEESDIVMNCYFQTAFYPSKIKDYAIFYNPTFLRGYRYIVTDKVATEIKRRKFTGVRFDAGSVTLAREELKPTSTPVEAFLPAATQLSTLQPLNSSRSEKISRETPNPLAQLYDALDAIQEALEQKNLTSLLTEFYENCVVRGRRTFADKIKNADWIKFQAELRRIICEIFVSNDPKIKAIYYEYDPDNAWSGFIFPCLDYDPLGENDD